MKSFQYLTLSGLLLLPIGCASTRPSAWFETPEAAVQRFAEASDDRVLAEELLGPGGYDLLRSGDDVADQADVAKVRELIQEQVEFEDVGDNCKVAILGAEQWELPIPLVCQAGRWGFDVPAGREEILNRRVGRNEILTIETLHEFVQAQREYAAMSEPGMAPAFASRILSSEGKRDGLYWPAEGEEPASPLGPLVAEAARDGYKIDGDKAIPYHGYFFRMLTEQGDAAPGGARSYFNGDKRLTRGFAFLAWPAIYGQSGVMTFQVNRQGVVFQRDLGEATTAEAEAIQAYQPDIGWAPTGG